MPNWVTNKVQAPSHVIRAMLNAEGLVDFNEFLPLPDSCGMDFSRKVWGTKWNACDSQAYPDAGTCQFDTAWSCPVAVLVKVSERFQDDAIIVTYAEEELGCNCGTFTLKAGQIVEQDIAPSWSELDDVGREKWVAFAHQVKGLEPEAEDDD